MFFLFVGYDEDGGNAKRDSVCAVRAIRLQQSGGGKGEDGEKTHRLKSEAKNKETPNRTSQLQQHKHQ